MTPILLLFVGILAAAQAAATITPHAIVRIETTFLTETPGGDPWSVTSCKIHQFVDSCVANNISGVSVELKRSDVNMNVASPQLGHLYFESTHANTAVYTDKGGYTELLMFELLKRLRAAQIKTYAWWPVFNDAVLASANSTNALHTRFDFGSTDPSNLVTSTQFVSVHSEEVRQHQLDMINGILSHPNMVGWDGVRLDYIRFNYDEDDFSLPARAKSKYAQVYAQDPHSMNPGRVSVVMKSRHSFRRQQVYVTVMIPES